MSLSRPLSAAFALVAVLGVVYAGEVQAPTQTAPRPTVSPATGLGSEDDAEKHVRRTACLKDARARKLVGAQRNAFVRNCLENLDT